MTACKDKTVYYDHKAGVKAAKRIKKTSGKTMYVYTCSLCHNFHLTRTSPYTYYVRGITNSVERKYLNK